MSAALSTKFVLTCGAVVALSLVLANDASAQGGFRIGNILQAGGGQGFRLGGERVGMHFGGGQGASIGTQRFGMRFGNGQGARIGGADFGMQFGGGQGTQIGPIQTTPSGTPGTYYYGDAQNGRVDGQPMIQRRPAGQTAIQPQAVARPFRPGTNPSLNNPSGTNPSAVSLPPGSVIQGQPKGALGMPAISTVPATGTAGSPAGAAQIDIARGPTPLPNAASTTQEAIKPTVAPEPKAEKSILVKETDDTSGKDK